MRNCFLCNEPCAYAGIDGNFSQDCPRFPDEDHDEEVERNFREYEDEMMSLAETTLAPSMFLP